VDNVAWLPPGLMRQLARWLAEQNVAVVFPKPFCSLTETSYGIGRQRRQYQNPLIAEFAHFFGRPSFQITYDSADKVITKVQVVCDTPCGCACYAGEHLTGVSASEAEHEAGLLHHHYPCLASMGIDADYNDTLMHISGHILKEEIAREIAVHKPPPPYLRPNGLSD
jgi:hypothetical protein